MKLMDLITPEEVEAVMHEIISRSQMRTEIQEMIADLQSLGDVFMKVFTNKEQLIAVMASIAIIDRAIRNATTGRKS
jgi:hypothetical protein